MLFLGASGQALEVKPRIGGNAVAYFKLSIVLDGVIQPIAETNQLHSNATFPLTVAQLAGWGWGSLTFMFRVTPFSQANPPAPLPVLLKVDQNNAGLQALGADNQPANGVAPPFGEVTMGQVTPPIFQDFTFGVYLP